MQLWFPPLSAGKPAAGHVALRFHDILSASFMTRREAAHFPHDWPRLMNEDRLEPLPVWNGSFSFNDDRKLKVLLREAGEVMTRHGCGPVDPEYHDGPVRLAFGAGPVMAAVSAKQLTVHAHGGEVPAGNLSGLHGKWWDYWREYWARRRTREALPYDPVCEVTMPAVEKKAYVPAERAEVERLTRGDLGKLGGGVHGRRGAR